MHSIIEYRDDRKPRNEYPTRIVSPTHPSPCCTHKMVSLGQGAVEGGWRYQYKRCRACGYSVRNFYAPSLRAEVAVIREMRLALANLNLGTGTRCRRSPAEVARERASAQAWPPPAPLQPKGPRRKRPVLPSAA
jgi:hypothetical protein